MVAVDIELGMLEVGFDFVDVLYVLLLQDTFLFFCFAPKVTVVTELIVIVAVLYLCCVVLCLLYLFGCLFLCCIVLVLLLL